MKFPEIAHAEYLGNCTEGKIARKAQWVENEGLKANKKIIHTFLRRNYPEFYESLALQFYNPYNYYWKDNYFILVHSSIEYLFRFESK